jgi:epoxyqueuosine reductase
MPESFSEETLVASAVRAGFQKYVPVNIDKLIAALDRVRWFPRQKTGTHVLLPRLEESLSGVLDNAFLVCALPYRIDEPEDLGTRADPHGLIAGFARRNFYRQAVMLLQRVVKDLTASTQYPAGAFRIFVNSGIPEKLIAYGAGLGTYGKNGLIYTQGYGSRCILALLHLPFQIKEKTDDNKLMSPDEFCGACAQCRAACPAHALRDDAMQSLSLCLKTRSDSLAIWDEETRLAWGQRFYGCDTCQQVCPKNRAVEKGTAPSLGVLGPGISLSKLLAMTEKEYRGFFRKTALGMSWILPESLLRNALCAAGNSGCRSLAGLVERFSSHPQPAVADMARWALQKLTGKIITIEKK